MAQLRRQAFVDWDDVRVQRLFEEESPEAADALEFIDRSRVVVDSGMQDQAGVSGRSRRP